MISHNMRKKPHPFVEEILKKLEPYGPIKARSMFGGYGIYYENVMFASIYQNTLYFRIDEYNSDDYVRYRSKQFIYEGAGKYMMLPYLELPQEILEDADLLPEWIKKSCEATLRNKNKKK